MKTNSRNPKLFSILYHVAEVLEYTKNEQLESLVQRTVLLFDGKYQGPGYGAYDAFKHAVSDPSILDSLDLNEDEREVLINNINRRLTPQAVKIQADIEVACYGYEGIDDVKEALRADLNCSTETMPIKSNLIAPPRYVMTISTLERTEASLSSIRLWQSSKRRLRRRGECSQETQEERRPECGYFIPP